MSSLEHVHSFGARYGAAMLGIASLLSFGVARADTTSTLLPVSAGAYNSWTPSTGSTHYTLVDESTCNGTTDYVYTTSASVRDSYGVSLASIPNGSTITAIGITPCASKNKSSSNSTMNVFYRFNGSNSADAGAYALSGTTPVDLATTNFSSLSLVKGSASTLEVGAVLSSASAGGRLSRIATVITYTTLAAPTTLAVTNVSGSENDLTWNDNSSNETAFLVERSTSGQYGPFTNIATTSANATSYQDTGRSADTTYWYRVRAYNAGGYSSYTNVSYGITATMVPNSPANLSVFGSTSTMYLSWTHTGSNEDGFRVERGTDGVNFTEVGTSGINEAWYTDSGLTSGTYYWRVRAYNAIGNSSYSNVVSATM